MFFAPVFRILHNICKQLHCGTFTDVAQLQLTAQTQTCTISQSSRAGVAMAAADAEIARFREILSQIDELETEFDKVRHIRDIVKGFRSRVEGLEKRVDGKGSRRR